MAGFFFLMTFTSFILLIYGFFAPKKVVFWQSDMNKRTKEVALKTYFWSMILSFFVFIAALPKKDSQQDQENTSQSSSLGSNHDNTKSEEEKVKKEENNIDSLDIYINKGDSAFYRNNFQFAIKSYEKSIKIKQNEYAYSKIAFIYSKQNLRSKVVENLLEARKLTDNDSIVIALAKAYYSNGQKLESLSEIKFLKNQGHQEATQLWDLYNPELTRITGYITRCCDGSSSMAKGRGACSHHGGVCNWNEPIYVKYREFE